MLRNRTYCFSLRYLKNNILFPFWIIDWDKKQLNSFDFFVFEKTFTFFFVIFMKDRNCFSYSLWCKKSCWGSKKIEHKFVYWVVFDKKMTKIASLWFEFVDLNYFESKILSFFSDNFLFTCFSFTVPIFFLLYLKMIFILFSYFKFNLKK